MYCILNWLSPDYSNLLLIRNEDGSPQLFETREGADREVEQLNGYVTVVALI